MGLTMTMCLTCGAWPCINPPFCATCRDADAHKARSERYVAPRIAAPKPTVETLMFSLRQCGTKALEEAPTKRRLGDLSDQQVIEVGNRLQRLRPEIARAWTKAEVEALFKARVGDD